MAWGGTDSTYWRVDLTGLELWALPELAGRHSLLSASGIQAVFKASEFGALVAADGNGLAKLVLPRAS